MESNIHLIPTDKPSRLCYDKDDNLLFAPNEGFTIADGKQNIYITDNSEIREGDAFLHPDNTIERASRDLDGRGLKKIILTTDPTLIADGIQSIDDEFLQWFVKNPSCERVEVEKWTDYRLKNNKEVIFYNYKIIIPEEGPKQETLEEAAEKQWGNVHRTGVLGFIEGAKWQQEQDKNKYSEEDMQEYAEFCIICYNAALPCIVPEDWFEQFKKQRDGR
jgi:hypothetical protein